MAEGNYPLRQANRSTMNHGEIVSFIWSVADLIRDSFKRGKYQDIILSLTVLRRLDCVLAPTKQKVLKRQAELRGKGLQDLGAQLKRRKFGRQVVKIEVGRGAVSSAQLRNHSAAIPGRWRRQD